MAELEEHLLPKRETNLEEEEIIEVTSNNSHSKESDRLDCDVESQNGRGIEVPAHILRYLYVGHFLARWGARMWEFSVGLFMLDVWPSSLLLPAVYGVVETASVAIFGPSVGDWIDRTHYIKVLKVLVGLQNISFIVAGGAVAVLLIYPSSTTKELNFILLVSLINASGALGALASLGAAILIERDWVVVISEGHSPDLLTQMNAVTRRIDLSCKLLAPVAAGFVMSYASMATSAICLVLWNVFSVVLEYWLLSSVYHAIPALNRRTEKEKRGENVSFDESLDHAGKETSIVHSTSNEENTSLQEKLELKSWRRKLLQKFLHIPTVEAWLVYFQQDVVLAGFALAMLYFTVLSFGTLMTAALKWKGIQSYVLGLARGVSAVIGISATLLYPIVHSHLQSLRTGLWSIWTQWGILIICVASIWVQNQLVSAWMLMGGVAASRLGLWMFDLSVVQIMQDSVPESDRGVVGGVQNSVQSFMDLLTYIMGIIVSDPKMQLQDQ
ncbi:solute carrier family 40 member 1 isoform X2 [Cryptomeria japonica]|uniref:solute carrier family 40 member 1 isoform X2 n=1 Tax=Cryptomeria japonica TaxID=3369 RepID=UPI0027D9DF46|nr:solute carrier family 40 member 1 isoform X2 [Cryptomeria japonica]